MAGPSGKLELTWANKDRRLLAHDGITYEWVDPADWRVSEVRLLPVWSRWQEVVGNGRAPGGDSGRIGYLSWSSEEVSATAMPSAPAAASRSRSPATMTVVSSRTRSAAARWTAS